MSPSLSFRLRDSAYLARAVALVAACRLVTTSALDQQCDTAHKTPSEALGAPNVYQRMRLEAERTKMEDLSLFNISSSPIHGRGVTATRPVKKETPIGILYYEVQTDMHDDLYPSLGGYWHARGFITDGGGLATERMPLRDALNRCNEMINCQGITFQDPEQQFADPRAELPYTAVDVEFKDKVHFRTDNENSWQSFLKHRDNPSAVYFPLGCSSEYLPNPPPSSLDPLLMIPCWPRYVNHSCRPNTVTVKVPVAEGFVIPGIPWKKVTGAYQVVTLKDIEEGEEILLNYELFQNYMLRRVDGVDECVKM